MGKPKQILMVGDLVVNNFPVDYCLAQLHERQQLRFKVKDKIDHFVTLDQLQRIEAILNEKKEG